MKVIKVIYDNGNNSLVKVCRMAHKNGKCLTNMDHDELNKLSSTIAR